MFVFNKIPYKLRGRQDHKRKSPSQQRPVIPAKRLRHFDYTTTLPAEILLHIFSHLTKEDLYCNVRMVCSLWCKLAMLSSPWHHVSVGNDVSTETLRLWMELSSPVIRSLVLADRNDTDAILNTVAKKCRLLETLSLENCWGSERNTYISSKTLCRLLTNCKKLGEISFEKVRIRSCKFFQLLTERRNSCKLMQLCYVGPVTVKQYNTLKDSCSGWVFSETTENV